MRIVSLLASGTEIVCALGAGDSLVGRSHECDNPASVKSLPACSEPAFDITLSSREIDAEVRRRLRAGEPLYTIHIDLIRELTPDLVIAQSHCEVCAVTPGDVERGGRIPGATILGLSAGTVEEIFETIRSIADAIGVDQRGHELVCQQRQRLASVRRAVAGRRRPSVAVLEWTDPIFPMGNWGPELVDAAGGELVIGNRGQHSHAVPSEQLRAADPEFLIVAPCGFDLQRTILELPVLERYPWWNELRAVKAGKVALADGNLFFNRSGITITQTAEIIAEIVHGPGEVSYDRHWLWMNEVPERQPLKI